MVLSIILFVIIIILLALLLMFLFYIFFPAIKEQTKVYDDPVISQSEIYYRKSEVHEKIPVTDKKAVVLCSCKKEFALTPKNYNSGYTCRMINSVYGTGTDCKYACIGLGDCVKNCPQSAITIENRTAVINNLCVGCGKCLSHCPLGIIALVSKDTKKSVICSNPSEENVSCSCKGKEEILEWNDKKGFKLWTYCYKMFKRVRSVLRG